jgi:predicted transcriptional regulator
LKKNTLQTLWNRRDRLKIMTEIMEVTKEEQLKTRIMYKVNLSFNQINEYLSFLTEMRFIKIQKSGNKKSYKTTDKGYSFIENYRELEKLLQSKLVETPMITKRVKIGRL